MFVVVDVIIVVIIVVYCYFSVVILLLCLPENVLLYSILSEIFAVAVVIAWMFCQRILE